MTYESPKLYDTYDRNITKRLEERLLETAEEPKFTPNAISVLGKRYFRKDREGNMQEDVKNMLTRVAANIAYPEIHYGASEEQALQTAQTFYEIMANREFMPNSPTLMSAGREFQQLSACFVLPIEDSMRSIFRGVYDTAMIHTSGGGTGFSYSRLRMKNDFVSTTHGRASGPVSFLKAYNQATTAVNQGGFRRGANMGVLRIDHPDIMEWIYAKSQEGQFPRFNLSVAITDDFMKALENDEHYILTNPRAGQTYELTVKDIEDQKKCVEEGLLSSEKELNIIIAKDRTVIAQIPTKKDNEDNVLDIKQIETGRVDEQGRITYNAKKVFDEIVKLAHATGDPGVVYIDTINKNNPTPHIGEIEATNPCIIGSTLISTEKGLLRMDQLVKEYSDGEIKIVTDNRVPIKIINKDGTIQLLQSNQQGTSLNKITKAFSTGIKKVYKIITNSGYELDATTDHKLLTKDKRGYTDWISIENLNINEHKILIQSGKGKFNSLYNLPFEIKNEWKGLNGKRYRLNLPNEWSKELGQILGYLIGDGWLISKDKNCRVGFTFGKNDKKLLNYFKPIINNFYGKDIKEVQREKGTIHLSYHSKYFVDFFRKLGIKSVKAIEKEVPESIFTAPEETVIGFLQGLFSADGTVNYRKNHSSYVRLTSKSIRLLKQMQIILLNLGIKSRIYDRTRKERKCFKYTTVHRIKKEYINDGICFELEITRKSVLKFLYEVGFINNKHRTKINKFKNKKFYEDCFEEKIRSIVYIGEQEVYDLTEPKTLSFITNGLLSLDCGEQPLLPYEACNLGSINLGLMVEDGNINYQKLEKTIKNAVHFLDNVVDMSKFALEEITEMVYGNRKIGLGIMGFADMLVKLRISYDSEEGIKIAEQVMRFIQEKSLETSIELGEQRGTFPNFQGSIYEPLEQKVRNAARTTIAPTGTISIISGASSGIEPYFDVAFKHRDADNVIRYFFNESLLKELERLGIPKEKVEEDMKKGKKFSELDYISEDTKRIFVTANEISPEMHVRMQAAFQKYTDNAISKTINMPRTATTDDVRNAYLLAYQLGCKGITVYRDGSREGQPLTTISTKEGLPLGVTIKDGYLIPKKRPRKVSGSTSKQITGCGNLFVTINRDEINRDEKNLHEVFASLGKAGGCSGALTEAVGRLTSYALRIGGDPEAILGQLTGISCQKPIIGKNGALSCVDGIAKVLVEELGLNLPETERPYDSVNFGSPKEIDNSKKLSGSCPECGSSMMITEGCYGGMCSNQTCSYSTCS